MNRNFLTTFLLCICLLFLSYAFFQTNKYSYSGKDYGTSIRSSEERFEKKWEMEKESEEFQTLEHSTPEIEIIEIIEITATESTSKDASPEGSSSNDSSSSLASLSEISKIITTPSSSLSPSKPTPQQVTSSLSLTTTDKLISNNDTDETDEMLAGESIQAYFKKFAGKTDAISVRYGRVSPQLLAAYDYKDHFSVVLSTPTKMSLTVYCRYIGENGKEIHEPHESLIYPFYVVYCRRKPGTTMIGITLSKSDSLSTDNTIKLIERKFKDYQFNVSFCLAPIYGDEPKWLHTVEMIEHYKLQGVKHFFIYIREISDYDLELIKSYEKSGEVEIIMIPGTNSDVIAQQLMAVSDCLLRSRTHSKWSIFADIDERLIMTDASNNIDSFLRNLTDESIGSIAFPQRWIMKRERTPDKFENDDQVINKMPTRAWHETSSAAMKGHSACKEQPSCWAKDIVNNEKVIRMLVHEAQDFYPGYKELFLDPSIGYIRHYRDVKMQAWEEKNRMHLLKFGPFSNTSYPPSFGSKLLGNVLDRLHSVYG